MSSRRRVSTLLTILLSLQLFACATARMEVPLALASTESWAVTGSNPRVWNRPISFGPWQAATVREGSTRSWALEAFGMGGGATRRPYVMILTGADGHEREVACMNRAVELWRGSFSVDLSGMASPRLACAVEDAEGSVLATLVLGERGGQISGILRLAGDLGEAFALAAVHRLAGSTRTSGDPVGYAVSSGDLPVAAVETVNRGRVWISPEVAAETREVLAAAAAALLLFDPGLSQR